MCGRYRRTTREEDLARIYRIPLPSQPDLPISYNIAPSQEVFAIRVQPRNQATQSRSLPKARARFRLLLTRFLKRTFALGADVVRFELSSQIARKKYWIRQATILGSDA